VIKVNYERKNIVLSRRLLLEEEKKTDSDESRQFQVQMLTEYLEPFSKLFGEAVEKNESADFYKTCCKLLSGYLDLEKGLVTVS
jgi:TorA maturation chaperone TorD